MGGFGQHMGETSDLARKNVAEEREDFLELYMELHMCLVNILVKILDKHVADARLPQRRIAHRPHNAARSALKR